MYEIRISMWLVHLRVGYFCLFQSSFILFCFNALNETITTTKEKTIKNQNQRTT